MNSIERIISCIGAASLLVGIMSPGLAFSQGTDPQAADITIACGSLTLTVDANNDFRMQLSNGAGFGDDGDPTVSNSDQHLFATRTGSGLGTNYQDNATMLPNEAFISVNDTRTIGGGEDVQRMELMRAGDYRSSQQILPNLEGI